MLLLVNCASVGALAPFGRNVEQPMKILQTVFRDELLLWDSGCGDRELNMLRGQSSTGQAVAVCDDRGVCRVFIVADKLWHVCVLIITKCLRAGQTIVECLIRMGDG